MKKGAPDPVASLASGLTLAGAPNSKPTTLNPQPPQVPDHELLRCIGRGSYGEVWLARSVLGEYRAVKVIHRREFGDNRPFEREFEGIRRYEPISRSHESQVQILHVGINQAEGYFYYVMELADDANAQTPHPGPLPPGKGDAHSALKQVEVQRMVERRRITVPSPGGEGQGENSQIALSRFEPPNQVGTRSTASPSFQQEVRDAGGTRPYQNRKEVHGEGGRFILHSSNSVLQDPSSYCPKTLRSLITPNSQPPTLNSQPTTARLPLAECIEIGFALTTALAHLHKQGLVHRDIKPSNIIFVKGRPKLADIGLVTDAGDAKSIVGTEGYLPPEGPGAPPADIYALGMVLYEISTGRDRRHFPDLPLDLAPQSAECGTRNAESTLTRSADTLSHPMGEGRGEGVRHLKGLLELDEILLKACARDARHRYQSAEEMHADLVLVQTGQSVRHKRSMEQLWAYCKKASLAVVLLALAVAALLTFLHATSRDTSNAAYRLSKNPDARKECEEGVHCSRRDTREGLRQGLEHFRKAIEFDPKFTMAYNGLFEVYVGGELLGLSRKEWDAGQRAMATKMMELSPSLAEAHAAQGWIDFLHWKWDTAERHFQQALQLNDNCAIAHTRYGFCLVFWGRVEEGRQQLLRAERLDSTLPRIKKNLGHVFYAKRQFPEAIKQYQAAIKLEPNYPIAHRFIGRALRAQGEYAKAIDEFQTDSMLVGDDAEKVRRQYDRLRLALGNDGPRGYWSESLRTAEQEGWLYEQAVCRANLGDYEAAFRLLDAYVEKHEPDMISFFFDECWDKVRSDSRFVDLLKKAGLRK